MRALFLIAVSLLFCVKAPALGLEIETPIGDKPVKIGDGSAVCTPSCLSVIPENETEAVYVGLFEIEARGNSQSEAYERARSACGTEFGRVRRSLVKGFTMSIDFGDGNGKPKYRVKNPIPYTKEDCSN